MEQFTYSDLASILQFGAAKMKMEKYLDIASTALEAELSGVTMEKKLDFEDEEYIIEHLTDDIEIRFGFNWAFNEIHIAFELSLARDRGTNDQLLFHNNWKYDLVKSYDIHYKCVKLTELLNGYNGLEEEFAIEEFISSGCKQLVTILNIPTSKE